VFFNHDDSDHSDNFIQCQNDNRTRVDKRQPLSRHAISTRDETPEGGPFFFAAIFRNTDVRCAHVRDYRAIKN
jgi:hypothetical protein